MAHGANWSRRRFLSARGLGASAGGLLGELMPDVPVADASGDGSVLQVCLARRAMGCEFNVFLPSTCSRAVDAGETALDEIDAIEQLLTVYANDSDVSYMNQRAAEGTVRTDDRLFRLLQRAAELHVETDGVFDIATHALIRTWGFFKGPKRVPTETELQTALMQSGMRHIELDYEHRSVRYLADGVGVNFGSIGKGYAIDRAIGRLRNEFGIGSAFIPVSYTHLTLPTN